MRFISHLLTYGGSLVALFGAVMATLAHDATTHTAIEAILIGIGGLITASTPSILAAARMWLVNRREQRQMDIKLKEIENAALAAQKLAETKAALLQEQLDRAMADHRQDISETKSEIGRLAETKAEATDTKAIAVTAATNAGRLDTALRKLEQIGEITPHTGKAGNKSRILVVGENLEIMRSYSDIFTELGFNVQSTGEVAGAIKILREHPPHWIILNLALVDGSGVGVLRYVRENHLRSKVAVVTKLTDDAVMEQVRQLKPDHFQHRPTDLQKLVKAIDPSLQLPDLSLERPA